MSKYVIKNCPAHFNSVRMLEFSEGDCNSDKVAGAYCKNITDCVMKQIVDECKETNKYYSFCLQKNRETNYKFQDEENMTWLMGRSHHANEILRLLEIEECE